MKLLSFKHIFILGALLAAGSVQVHAADEVTGKSEELELTDSIVHDTPFALLRSVSVIHQVSYCSNLEVPIVSPLQFTRG